MNGQRKSRRLGGEAVGRYVFSGGRRVVAAATLLAAVFLGSVEPAAAAYVQRYVVSTRGGVTFTGNALGLSRDLGAPGLLAPGVLDSIGAFSTTDTSLQVGTYPPGTTDDWHLNSATAQLTLPAGSSVLYAELIWGASINFGGEDVTAFINTPVTLTPPTGAPASVILIRQARK